MKDVELENVPWVVCVALDVTTKLLIKGAEEGQRVVEPLTEAEGGVR